VQTHAVNGGASPEALLALVGAERDREAFAALFRHFAPRLKGHLQARGIAAATADELVQETMVSVWRHAAQFDAARGTAATWVFAIARNALVSHVRRERRVEPEPDDPCAAEPAGSTDEVEAPDALYLRAERERVVAAALSRLPAEQQQTLRSAYYTDRSLSEVAHEHGVPLGTVKTRVRLALQKLRAALGGGERP
jgi:RNA polymerase sigma-70 factor (ECF subfamily)